MKKRRGMAIRPHGTTHRGRATRGHLRLVLEPLECRRLLAGINVSVLVDGDQSTGVAAGQHAAAGRLVYLDENLNAAFDAGEAVRVTDAGGNAVFDGLAPGDYSVGLLANSAGQQQISPSRVAPTASKVSDAAGRFVLSNADRTRVWTLDASGRFTSAVGGEPEYSDPQLAGASVQVEQLDSETAWVVSEFRGEQQSWRFSLETGELVAYSVSGLPDDAATSRLTLTSDGVAALVSSGSANYIATGKLEGDSIAFDNLVATVAHDIHGVSGSPLILTVDAVSESQDQVSVVDPKTGEAQGQSHTLAAKTQDITIDRSGSRAVIVVTSGGAEVLDLSSGDAKLAALLAEARSPVSISSNSKRVTTGDRSEASRLIVWDTDSWLPAGRTVVGDGNNLADILELPSNELLTVGSGGLYSVLSNSAANVPVTVGDQPVDVRFGVAVNGSNSPPVADFIGMRVLDEDASDAWDLSTETAFGDADGDRLWYSIGTPPAHGELSLDPSGRWLYQPDGNYFGEDSATIRLHDGIDSTEVSIHLTVEPVNDLPERMYFDIPPIAESAQVGDFVGFVSIVDVDRDAVYQVTTSDPRFSVIDGRVYLASGSVDFESASELAVAFLATDTSDERIKISTTKTLAIADVNEPPTAIRLDGSEVAENEPGAPVGTVLVVDPDAEQQYQLNVSDDRFEIVDGVLKLVAGHELDRETESEVAVEITAIDPQNPVHAITAAVTVSVGDRNDPPGDITLSRHSVEEDYPGASVGSLAIADPDGDVYQFSVSDERFEVSGNRLQLRWDVALSRKVEPSVAISVTARAASGDTKTATFEIEVLQFSPYQNPFIHHDVNGDGQITPLDVLILVNLLNQQGYQLGVPPGGNGGSGEPGSAIYPDVNGDKKLSPLDVLMIVNYLNGHRGSSSGEGEALDALASSPMEPVYGPLLPDSFDRFQAEKKERRQLDAELENLVNELSAAR